MSRRGDKNRDIKLRGQFIPAFVETRRTPAWKAMSMGARELYMTLRGHHFVGLKNNNGRIFLSERKAMEEMGVRNRESIRRWFRELQHYGFLVMTNPGSLGVAGKGKAPQWRLTELETPLADSKEPTLDYKKWNGTPFNGNQAWRGRGQKPKKQNPGRETTSISRLTTGGGVGGSLIKQKEGELPWIKPTLEGDRALDPQSARTAKRFCRLAGGRRL